MSATSWSDTWVTERGLRVRIAGPDRVLLGVGLATPEQVSQLPPGSPLCRDFGDRLVSRLADGRLRVNLAVSDLRAIDGAFGRMMVRLEASRLQLED